MQFWHETLLHKDGRFVQIHTPAKKLFEDLNLQRKGRSKHYTPAQRPCQNAQRQIGFYYLHPYETKP
jgi:hypothetical protein